MSPRHRFAVVAALAALSLPAFASEPSSSIANDPTFPQVANPAPAFVLDGPATASLRDDPNFPQVESLAPSVVLTRYTADPAESEPVEGPPLVHYALVPDASHDASPARVAGR